MQTTTPEERVTAFAEDFARLLAAANVSDEEKQAWAELVPDMSPEQLVRFYGVLLNGAMKQSEDQLSETTQKIAEATRMFDERSAKASQTFKNAVAAIMEQHNL